LPWPLPVAGVDAGVALDTDRHKALGELDLLDPAKRKYKTLVPQIQYASDMYNIFLISNPNKN
jgi:hypothetical protein